MTSWARPLASGQVLPAPRSGIELGQTKAGPLTLRLFRQRGTRAVVLTAPHVARLLALRAALAGASVRVASTRTSSWAGVVRHGGDTSFVPSLDRNRAPAQTPTLLVDDLGSSGPVGDVPDWHCHLRVGHLDEARLDLTRVAGLAHVEVAFFDAVSAPLATEIGRALGLGEASASLTVVPRHAVAVVTRGQVHLVRPELTAGERSVLGV
ncbi:hypothetical protein [Nocardioides hwasunensis]|uniref:Uncharacterized protein n=1 Tax=Nocardioides hwasunensis TaxID=397258 RepID=A0ABR8MHX4_9ACTN|nr:hypothetical protein [Nocardioides hwasunensis]MBD3915528.1 hypothetical protein [Nocardioides hwasunensis]